MNFFAQCRKACVGRKAPGGARDHRRGGVGVVGILCFGEAATWPRLASMALILVGIAGLKFFSA